jgi:sirohydrochlorin cobaltochelatase
VDRLRAWGVADEITAAFWKEPPGFHEALRLVTADQVTVVPVFTARGYFTQTVIPTEMGLTGDVSRHAERTVRYTRTLGEHSTLTEMVRRRVTDWLAQHDTLNPREAVAVAIIGHSTKLNAESRKATERQADALRAANIVAEVVAVYLDDVPAIADAYQLTSAPVLIAVPYFIAEGSHVTIDIPQALGLASGQAFGDIQGRALYYLPPVGADEALTDAILDLARESGGSFEKTPVYNQLDLWRGFPQAGASQLIDAVRTAGKLQFGQLALTLSEVAPIDRSSEADVITTPAQMRALVRGAVNGASFRPLPTMRDLPGGWHVPISAPEQLPAVVETVYPGAISDWAAHQSGTLTVEALETTIARQTGRLRALTALAASETTAIIQQVCTDCVRQPIWHTESARASIALIPCAASCNWWLDNALHTLEATENHDKAK